MAKEKTLVSDLKKGDLLVLFYDEHPISIIRVVRVVNMLKSAAANRISVLTERGTDTEKYPGILYWHAEGSNTPISAMVFGGESGEASRHERSGKRHVEPATPAVLGRCIELIMTESEKQVAYFSRLRAEAEAGR
ncbi:MAG: hypothetical protein HYS74_00060 [Parcubacteria group bacterium]|nr:hypothetical protein [Parcubacteria group bacterium]